MPPPNEQAKWTRAFARYMELGVLLPASTFTGYAIGYLLDKWLGTTFLGVTFLILGTAGGVIELIRKLSGGGPKVDE